MFVLAKLPKPAMAECRHSCVIFKARTVVGGVRSAVRGMDKPVILAIKDGLEHTSHRELSYVQWGLLIA